MATLDPARFSPVRPVAHALDLLGDQVQFQLRAFGMIPYAIRHYPGEILRLLALVSFGRGALALIGGTVVTVGFLTTFVGIELGIQGYNQLSTIGVESLTGFVSAYVNTRLAAPFIAGIALVSGAGAESAHAAHELFDEIDRLAGDLDDEPGAGPARPRAVDDLESEYGGLRVDPWAEIERPPVDYDERLAELKKRMARNGGDE
jgi:hypothetical protein